MKAIVQIFNVVGILVVIYFILALQGMSDVEPGEFVSVLLLGLLPLVGFVLSIIFVAKAKEK